jgi:hypothetical protein
MRKLLIFTASSKKGSFIRSDVLISGLCGGWKSENTFWYKKDSFVVDCVIDTIFVAREINTDLSFVLATAETVRFICEIQTFLACWWGETINISRK